MLANVYYNFHSYRPKRKLEDDSTLKLQKFIFEDNRIVCSGNFDLVLGVRESESGRGEVVLVKRRPDDIMQCWIMQPNGLVREGEVMGMRECGTLERVLNDFDYRLNS